MSNKASDNESKDRDNVKASTSTKQEAKKTNKKILASATFKIRTCSPLNTLEYSTSVEIPTHIASANRRTMKIVSTLLTTTGLVASAQAFVAPTTQGRAEIMTAESSSCSTSTMQQMSNSDETNANCNRRVLLGGFLSAVTTIPFLQPDIASADVDVEDYIRSGMVSMPMGVSGQAGKRYDSLKIPKHGKRIIVSSKFSRISSDIAANSLLIWFSNILSVVMLSCKWQSCYNELAIQCLLNDSKPETGVVLRYVMPPMSLVKFRRNFHSITHIVCHHIFGYFVMTC